MHGTDGKFQIELSGEALNGGARAEKITRDVQRGGRGVDGDFERLARSLRPKPADRRVGRRELDAQAPGSGLPGIDNPDLGGVLRLGGALRAPETNLNEREVEEAKRFEDWEQPYPHKFQTALSAFINLADDYSGKAPDEANRNPRLGAEIENDPDPLITPPYYGQWHAPARRLLLDINGYPISPDDNWAHQLNLDPRFRVPAGLGAQVAQEKREEFMSSAWEQAGEEIEANRRIRVAQLAREVSRVWYEHRLKLLREARVEKAFAITAPAHKRVLSRDSTIFNHLESSAVTPALVSLTMRRLLRSRGRLTRLLQFGGIAEADNLIARVNDGDVGVPAKQSPSGLMTVNQVSEELGLDDAPPSVAEALPRKIGAALSSVYSWLNRRSKEAKQSGSIREGNQTAGSVDRLPRSPDFVIAEPDSGFTPKRGSTDSPEAARFKSALKDAYALIEASARAAETPPRNRVDIAALADDAIEAINPEPSIARRALQVSTIPDRLKANTAEGFKEATVYPEIDRPMYEPLKEVSPELFLPNINLIEPGSVTLLETNQRFIEAYLVGLNHEFTRELLWREYPTDQRGSCFHRFWDKTSTPYVSYTSHMEIAEESSARNPRDISPLGAWPKFSDLGDHNLRQENRPKEEEVVLVIRGELLNKYPNTLIYAHRARWGRGLEGRGLEGRGHEANDSPNGFQNGLAGGLPNGHVDDKKGRRLEELAAPEIDNHPRGKTKTPIFAAKVEPDLFFFGFDLTVEQAMGGVGENSYDDPGWFFVIKEQPVESRSGPDVKNDMNVRDDLSWKRALPGAPASSYIQVNNATSPFKAPEERENSDRRGEGALIERIKDSSAADPSYTLRQTPAMVAIHAAEMLPKK